MAFYYITQAMLSKNFYGKRIFSPLQEDIIVFHFFSPDKEQKLLVENKLSIQEYTKLREKTFKKLESVICKIVTSDLRTNIFSPEAAQKRLEMFWQSKQFPLKNNLKDILIEQKIGNHKDFLDAKQIQEVASRHNKPWILLKRPKFLSKKTRPRGVYKNADKKTKALIAEIDKEEYEKSKIISITCSEKMAKYLLNKLSEVLKEKFKEE